MINFFYKAIKIHLMLIGR